MNKYSEEDIVEYIDQSISNYNGEKSSESLVIMYKLVSALVSIVSRTYKSFSKDDNDHVKEVTLDFMSHVVTRKHVHPIKETVQKLLNHRMAVNKLSSTGLAHSNFLVDDYAKDPNAELLLRETIRDHLEDHTEEERTIILTLISEPYYLETLIDGEKPSLRNQKVFLSYFELRKKLFTTETRLSKIIPDTNTGRMIIFSALYELEPALIALFLLTKDLNAVLNFVTMFQGSTIKVPRLEEVFETIENSRLVSNSLENETLTIRERELLTSMCATSTSLISDDEIQLTPVLDSYIRESIGSSLRMGEELNKKVLDKAGKSTNDLTKLYETMSKESNTQLALLKEIISVISTSQSLSDMLNKISRN